MTDLVSTLKNLIQLKPGDTVSLNGDIQSLDSWTAWFYRRGNRDNYSKTCDYLTGKAEEAMAMISTRQSCAEELVELLPDYIIALQTYVATCKDQEKWYAEEVNIKMTPVISDLQSFHRNLIANTKNSETAESTTTQIKTEIKATEPIEESEFQCQPENEDVTDNDGNDNNDNIETAEEMPIPPGLPSPGSSWWKDLLDPSKHEESETPSLDLTIHTDSSSVTSPETLGLTTFPELQLEETPENSTASESVIAPDLELFPEPVIAPDSAIIPVSDLTPPPGLSLDPERSSATVIDNKVEPSGDQEVKKRDEVGDAAPKGSVVTRRIELPFASLLKKRSSSKGPTRSLVNSKENLPSHKGMKEGQTNLKESSTKVLSEEGPIVKEDTPANSEPEGRTNGPEGRTNGPEGRTNGPEGRTNEPEKKAPTYFHTYQHSEVQPPHVVINMEDCEPCSFPDEQYPPLPGSPSGSEDEGPDTDLELQADELKKTYGRKQLYRSRSSSGCGNFDLCLVSLHPKLMSMDEDDGHTSESIWDSCSIL